MGAGTIAVLVVVALSALYWLALAAGVLKLRRVRSIADLDDAAPDRWPKLSIVVPACNEIRTLEEATRSRLRSAYPNLELVLIDDRSTDGTSELVDRLAREDARIVAAHIERLPDGWLGKVHALHVGMRHATGEWVLFTDADVHLSERTLPRVIAFCEAQRFDHVSVYPALWPVNAILDAAFVMFTRMALLFARAWAVPDARSTAALGIGAFNLVRRSVFDRTPGFEWLRMETADDATLGQMMKRAGRSIALLGREDVGLVFCPTLGDAARSAEKGGSVFRFRLAPVFGFAVVMTMLEVGVFAGLFASGVPWLQGLAGFASLLALRTNVGTAVVAGQRALPALLLPIGSVLMIGLTARAGFLAWRNGGIRWRNTLYPADQLLAGRRIKLP